MPIEPLPPRSPTFSAGSASSSYAAQSSPPDGAESNPPDATVNRQFDPSAPASGSRQLSRYAGPVPLPAHSDDFDVLLSRLHLSSALAQERGNSWSSSEAEEMLASWVRKNDPAVADSRQAIARMLSPYINYNELTHLPHDLSSSANGRPCRSIWKESTRMNGKNYVADLTTRWSP